jgi:thymidylate synthase (FAD)
VLELRKFGDVNMSNAKDPIDPAGSQSDENTSVTTAEQPLPERLTRPSAPALDLILGQAFKVLDDGFVRVVDYLGSDEAIVQAARVSYGKGTKRLREDRALIRYLIRNRHTTPLEMCEIKLHVRVPMDCWRQWIRHRTANVNEYSTRYSVAIDAAQRTSPDAWRAQSPRNRQGSLDHVNEAMGRVLSASEGDLQKLARTVYEERLAAGVAREQARKDLPLSTYTEAYWKVDLHNLFHFLSLRMDEHAQEEIRSYANVIGREIVGRWCPIAWEAFEAYSLGAISLTRDESKIMRLLIANHFDEALRLCQSAGFLAADGKLTREGEEFAAKLPALGITGLPSAQKDIP